MQELYIYTETLSSQSSKKPPVLQAVLIPLARLQLASKGENNEVTVFGNVEAVLCYLPLGRDF